MSDKLHRFLLENLHVRGEWVLLEDSWKEIQNTANYPQPIRNVLGEALAVVSLLADSLKFDGSLIFQIQGTKPVSMLVVQATSDGSVRGIAKWKDPISNNASFQELFGSGTLAISIENQPKQGSNQGERYQSFVSLEGDSISNCLRDYFSQSEQLETKFCLAVDDNKVAGLMLQSIPANEDQEENWNHASVIADTLTKNELLTLNVEDLLHRLFHEEDLRLYQSKPVYFKCSCSQEKIENTVYSLGLEDVNVLMQEKGVISIDCEFCNKHYELDSVDIARIFNDAVISNSRDKGNDIVIH